MTSITPFLWFDNNVPEAVAFYKSVFPNARCEKSVGIVADLRKVANTLYSPRGAVQRPAVRPRSDARPHEQDP